ncbi:MAG: O-antigen polymerase [Algibacter sp.]
MIYFYVLLLRIVAYIEGPFKMVAFAITFGLISFSSFNRVSIKSFNKISKYNFYALALVILIMFHGFIFGEVLIRDIAVLLTYWIWFVFTFTYFRDKTLNESLRFVLISFLIFNFANYLYFKLYFADQFFGINSIMASFGVFGKRIYFPLASGANIFTSQLGLNALIVLYFFKNTGKRLFYLSIYGFYIYMLVLADSRLILLLSIIFSIIFWFSLKKVLSFFKNTWWIIGLFIFGFLYVFYNTDFFDRFKRPGELSGGGAISRIEIWTIAIQVIFDDLHLLFGHGLNGFKNNILESTKETFNDQHLQTSHNFIIQNLIDFGVFGILIILMVLFKILNLIIQLKSSILTILIVMLLLVGITESIPSFYSFEPTMFFITILSIIFAQDERKNIRFITNNNILS